MSLRVGIDSGGTFTDFVLAGDGGLTVHKVRSSPGDPTSAIVDGLAHITDVSAGLTVVHGLTVATNAVLERKGARVALVVTAGFEHVLQIGRQTRPDLYDIFVKPRLPLVDPRLIFGIAERVDADGRVLVPLDVSVVDELARRVAASGAEIAAVCLLHSYRTPGPEDLIAARFRLAGLAVCTSHDVLPEYREYERWSTTAVNAYVTPLIDRYLGRLEGALQRMRLSIMQSDGGSISARAARARAVRTVLSGPAAGVVGAETVARAAGFDRIISFDMGGTSTDVSLVDRQIATTPEASIGDVPVRVSAIDIHTVGAGGGSVARLDAGGALRVGPESAGAVPGPACYGIGTDPTVTDANVILGRLDPDYFLGGRMTLDVARARSCASGMARLMNLSVEAIAQGIVRVANASMERAIRAVSLERGHDPRRFVLVAFGGAGGMHACDLASALEMDTILVPRHAGVLSALGMLAADVTRDYAASVLCPSAALTMRTLTNECAPLVARARQALADEGFRGARQVIERQIDVRYIGQSYEITVPWSARYERSFHAEHQRVYGYANPARPTEVVALRVRATGVTGKPVLPFEKPRRRTGRLPGVVRRVWFGGRAIPATFHRWDDLRPGASGHGPVVVCGGEATVVVSPGFRFDVDGFGNVVLTRRR